VTRLNRNRVVEILRLVGCENLISQRKEFIFNAFIFSQCRDFRTGVILFIVIEIVIIFLNVIAPIPVMCSFMLLCQCCFATVKVLLKKVTYSRERFQHRFVRSTGRLLWFILFPAVVTFASCKYVSNMSYKIKFTCLFVN